MKQHRRTIRIVIAAVMLVAGFCLVLGSSDAGLTAFFRQTIPALTFLETGRFPYVFAEPQPTQPTQPTQPPETETAPQTVPTEPPEEAVAAVLTREDLELVRVNYRCSLRPKLEPLMLQPLAWDLTQDGPAVLIVHTHATECYADGAQQYNPYRSLDGSDNMTFMGKELARLLEEGGIRVLHDATYHDYPNYNHSYSNTRKTIAAYLEKYPSIRMVLDLHRDASDSTEGQLVTSATVGGQKSAQLMMVVGTNAMGNYHPNWQENLALGLKLSAVLEQENPGICRPVTLREERFNMDMTTGSLLVEVGAAGNTQQEALIAIHALAQGILTLAHGANVS